MSDYYLEILNLKEAKDFGRIIKKWEVLSNNLVADTSVPMVLPDLLWVSKPGVGKTHLLKLLSEYLYERKNLMEFYGNVKYFEFMLDYSAPGQTFDEVRRMISEVQNAAGFRNVYKGIISIDIDEWLGHCEEKNFISFLEYLSSNSNDWLIVFNVAGDKTTEIKKLESVLSMFFRIEKSYLVMPDTNDFLQFVMKRLSTYNLTLNQSAQDLLFKTIEKLKENKFFDGYKTLTMLCQDIVYEFFSRKESLETVISAEHLVEFAPDSKYIERATWKNKNKSKIGLIN